MKFYKNLLSLAMIAAVFLTFASCNIVKDLSQAVNNIQRLQFRLESVNNFHVAGIALKEKTSIQSFNLSDGLKLSQAFMGKSFPAEFILNVEAKNPNDGTKGTKSSTALLSALEWRLLIDDVPTINGNIDKPIEIPGVGTSTIIPLRISLDLYKFFSEKGYDSVINMALAIGGAKGSTSHLKLDIKPTVRIAGTDIIYPGRITVVDKTFN